MCRINPETDILGIIDPLNCFTPGGSLPVADGDLIFPVINRIARFFRGAFAAQDWHPHDHVSFLTSHPASAGPVVETPYGEQRLFPRHGVQNSRDAEFHPSLRVNNISVIIRKGMNRDVDSYSAFFENDRTTRTGLDGYLKEIGIKRIFLTGLATDFCVGWTALDALALGYEVVLVIDACRGLGIPTDEGRTTVDDMLDAIRQKGGVIIDSDQIVDGRDPRGENHTSRARNLHMLAGRGKNRFR